VLRTGRKLQFVPGREAWPAPHTTRAAVNRRVYRLVKDALGQDFENLYFAIKMVATCNNLFEREATRSLCSLNRNCSWHVLTISVLFVVNIFIKKSIYDFAFPCVDSVSYSPRNQPTSLVSLN